MALNEYLGAIVMEIDGKEVEVESLDVSYKTGRKLVKTMNKLMPKKAPPPAAPAGPTELDVLLQIRDSLNK